MPLKTQKSISAITPFILLGLSLLFGGGKWPWQFFLWSLPALAFCGYTAWNKGRVYWEKFFPGPALAVVFIGIAYLFSLDRAVSLFPTLKGLTFVLVWLALRADRRWISDERGFWFTLLLLGGCSILLTFFQILQGRNEFGLYNAYGFLPINPGFNGIWLASLSVACLARSLCKTPVRAVPAKVLMGFAILLALFVLLNPARTRSAPLALALGVFYVLSRHFSLKKIFLGCLAVGSLAFVSIPNEYLESRLRISGRYAEPNYRTRIWGIALRAVAERPWTGYGPGNFELAYQKYAFPVEKDFVRYSRTTTFAHNEYLQVASDMGIIPFGLMLVTLLFFCFYPTNENNERQVPAKAALWAIMGDAFFNLTWHLPLLVFLTLLWWARLSRSPQESASPGNGKQLSYQYARMSFSLITGCLLGSLGYSAARSHWLKQGHWQRVLSFDQRDAAAWSGVGSEVSGSHAAKAYARAIQSSPRNPYYRESFGRILESSPFAADHQQAKQQYQHALRLAPHRAINALGIGRIEFRSKHYQDALEWFKYALQQEPRYWEAYIWVSRSLFELGQKQEAQRILSQLPLLHSQHEAEYQRMISSLAVYTPSGYETVILSYDPQLIKKDLHRMKQGL